MKRPWEVDEPQKPKDSHREFITQIDCTNFAVYHFHTTELIRAGFVLPVAPIEDTLIQLTPEKRKGLKDLVDQGYEVVVIPHYDADGHRIDDKFEVYRKPYQR
jgi:hypothetical protein